MQSCDAGSLNCVTIDLSLLIDKLCALLPQVIQLS